MRVANRAEACAVTTLTSPLRYTFDARNNVPRVGRVLIARGRDAADVAISNTFGLNTLERFIVHAEESARA